MSKGFKAWLKFCHQLLICFIHKMRFEVPFFFPNGSPLAKTALDVSFVLEIGRIGRGS